MKACTKLCLAAALNSTGFAPEDFDSDKRLQRFVIAEVEGWYQCEPISSSASYALDRDAVLEDVRKATPEEIRNVLLEMGFEMPEWQGMYSMIGDRCGAFIDDQFAAIKAG